jgi:hypothetical protein
VARSLEISTTRDRSASVISFATGVVGFVVCHPTEIKDGEIWSWRWKVWPIKFWAKSFATGIKNLVDDLRGNN